uniref:Uncharacterized protein n=1 Tax=Rhizophora mucronata TaxID=61149 RepID=A0A2P2QY86_RHIMU
MEEAEGYGSKRRESAAP